MDKYKILIVDDQLIGRQLLESVLFTEDYNLFFAEDGQEALDKIYEHQPDVVLLDVMMPQIDGFEVCKRVRSDAQIKDTPIILITALDDRDSRLNGFEVGANDYISKPIDRLELLARTRNLTQLFRYKKQSEGLNSGHAAQKIVEAPQEFLNQMNQYLAQSEDENLKKYFPDFFELIHQTGDSRFSASLSHEQNGTVNFLYFQCVHHQFCNEAMVLLSSFFPKAVSVQFEIGLKNAFNNLIEKLDKYFQERFQQSISEKASLIWVNVNRNHHKVTLASSNIESRLFSENGDGYIINRLKEENEFKNSDKILIFPAGLESNLEDVKESNFANMDSFISHLTNSDQEVMIAGFTLG